MDKEEIRKKLKNNFLKRLIFRIDFSGMMDADVEKFIQNIRPRILESGYTVLKEEFGNNVNVNVLSPKNIETSNEITKIYVFNSKHGKELKISKSFVIFEIDIERNKTLFSSYTPLISYIIEELKAMEFVQFDRIGLRKINVCILFNKRKLNQYFKDKVLCRFDDESSVTQVADELYAEDYKVNFNRRFQEGTILEEGNTKVVYQILLDIDSYMDDNEKVDQNIRENDSSEILKKLNDIIYDIYIESLDSLFIDKLVINSFDDDEIRGVTKNV